jgi:hypothetical protein
MTDEPMPPPAPKDPRVWAQPEFDKRRKFTLEADFYHLFTGDMPLPNFEPIPHWEALRSSLWMYGRSVERFKRKGDSFDIRVKAKVAIDTGAEKPTIKSGDAIYYLNCGQGGGFTGEGVVVIVVGYSNGPESVITGKFAICKHESVENPGANHQRGWHPAHCKKCGLDLSVDSGD